MAAQIDPEMTFDDMESEILYTRAALEADLDASDLVGSTDAWMPLVDTARARDRDARAAKARADARRRIANGRLDATCARFGDELYVAVGKDRGSARWRRFFTGARDVVSAFVRMPLREQVSTVTAWLGGTGDDVLERHRADLLTWSTAASAALDLTATTAMVRGEARVVREETAESLTRLRDALEATLVQRAQERSLPRDWPSMFFRTRSRRAEEPSAPTPPPVTA